MEYLANGSLAQKLAGAPQAARQAAQLVATLAEAMQTAHGRGIVHRDLKPANVLLAEDGTPKISDFGLARQQDDGAGLTQTGVTIGTPSYMAPEQARGRPDASGPAVDVYALGAILYELLTGRPPFRAATSAETVQQVISQEPAPPSRLNDQVPRDLETICLKCLNKDPRSRYGTAVELVDDLARYERGVPILARRAGSAERLVKWVRRNRSLAAFLVSGILLVNVLISWMWWMFLNREALAESVQDDSRQVVEAERKQAWGTARTALERAKVRLGDGGQPSLQQRVHELERELTFVERLDQIRDSCQRMNAIHAPDARIAADYEHAFRDAGLFQPEESPAIVAARIRSSVIAETILAALDDWRLTDKSRQVWLGEVAELVDQNPVTRQIRDPTVWDDKEALAECLRTVQIENQSVNFLTLAGIHLEGLRGDSLPVLQRLQLLHPGDYWVNSTLAGVLYARGNLPESVRYFQAAVAARPASHVAHGRLGIGLSATDRNEDALKEARIAHRMAPTEAAHQVLLGNILARLHRPDEGLPYMLRACEMEPNHADWQLCLAFGYFELNRHDDAISVFRRAISLEPQSWFAHQKLHESLQKLGRLDELQLVWRKSLDLNPPDQLTWDGYAELCLYLARENEYRRVRTELLNRFGDLSDPRVAERTGRACLLLPLSADELRQASVLIDRALAADLKNEGWLIPYFRFAKALAEYRAGNCENARSLLSEETLKVLGPGPRLLLAMVQHRLSQPDEARETLKIAIANFNWDLQNATYREAWIYHILRREAEFMLASKP
jgi:serine/threonine-protein kinase